MNRFFGILKKNSLKILIMDVIVAAILIVVLLNIEQPKSVQGLSVASTTYDTVGLEWEDSDNAKVYRIYRAQNGGDFKYITATEESEFVDSGLRTGDQYTYKVTSFNVLKSSSAEEAQTVDATPQLSPPKLKLETKKGEMELSYSKVSGAIAYEIFRDDELIGSTAESSYVDKDVSDEEEHSYNVRAVRYKKEPVYSALSNSQKGLLKTVHNMTIEAMDNDLLIKWENSDYYNIYKLYDGENLLQEGSDTNYRLSDFETMHEYDFRLIAYTDDESNRSPELDKTIAVSEEPMTNEEARLAACEWAKEIAADDTFTYGTGNRAHRYGCYFCGTNTGPNLNKKGKSLVNGHSYEKTYCCNPFVHAAYAHGAGDANMLKACQNGGGVAMSVKSYTRYGNWKSVGKPSKGSLQPGDVLVRSGHVMLYVGDGQIAHAGSEGWDEKSIRVNNLADKSYSRVEFVMRYTGTGRGVKRVVRDLDEKGNMLDTDGNVVGNLKENEA